MAKYCDAAKLEQWWFRWLMASRTPQFEHLRQHRLLWSRPVEYVDDGAKRLPNPLSAEWQHCVALGRPFHIRTSSEDVWHDATKPVNEHGLLPDPTWLTLDSNHPVHNLGNPFWVPVCLLPELRAAGYIFELPADQCWEALVADINKIAEGVARKYSSNDDDRAELSQEAVLQVIRKLRNGKLTYTPGRASVFNLLTTTIHRIVFSMLNRSGKQRKNTKQLATDLKTGRLNSSLRSLRVPIRA